MEPARPWPRAALAFALVAVVFAVLAAVLADGWRGLLPRGRGPIALAVLAAACLGMTVYCATRPHDPRFWWMIAMLVVPGLAIPFATGKPAGGGRGGLPGYAPLGLFATAVVPIIVTVTSARRREQNATMWFGALAALLVVAAVFSAVAG